MFEGHECDIPQGMQEPCLAHMGTSWGCDKCSHRYVFSVMISLGAWPGRTDQICILPETECKTSNSRGAGKHLNPSIQYYGRSLSYCKEIKRLELNASQGKGHIKTLAGCSSRALACSSESLVMLL